MKFVYSRIQQICIKYYVSGTSVRDTLGPVIEIAGVLLALCQLQKIRQSCEQWK